MYSVVNFVGESFWMGFSKLFQNEVATSSDAELFLHKVALVFRVAAIQMQSAGIFKDADLRIYTQCIKSIQGEQVSDEMMTYIQAAFDAFNGQQYQSSGLYLGMIASRMCEVSTTILA